MDSNSEDSFAWTDASDDTSDSKNMSTKSSTIQSGEESESGKLYKKKLQEHLFSGCDEVCQKPKKRKLSQQHNVVENGASPKKKRIKTEPESDIDSKKEFKSSLHYSINTSNDSYEESFLDEKVKNEQSVVVPTPMKTKRKKNKSLSLTNDTFVTEENEYESPTEIHSSTRLEAQEGCDIEEESNYTCERHEKKKKHKKKIKHLKSDISGKSYSVTGEYSAKEVDNASDVIHNISTDSMQRENKSMSKETLLNNTVNINNSDISDNNKSLTSKVSSENSKHKSKLSDRIMFEDENYFNEDVPKIRSGNNRAVTTEKTTKLQKFVEKSNTLYKTFNSEQLMAYNVTNDDDLWLVKCPKDINVNSFLDKKWTLDNKCKVKLDSVKYEGSLENKKTNISFVTTKERKVIIQNFPINGCVRLHRRIPKLHIQHDHTVANNPSNFIPLPDTKCRHPLLGAHYKRALKLPRHVAERLKDVHNTLHVSEKKHKKKVRKYEKFEDKILISNVEPSVRSKNLTETVYSSKKKKRKHKHTDPNQESEESYSKKPKYDPKSADTWDSEKAIEETLFNC